MPAFALESRLDGAVGGKTAAALEPRVRHADGGRPARALPAPLRAPRRAHADLVAAASASRSRSSPRSSRVSERRMQKRKGSILEVVISDGQGELSLTFFNQSVAAARTCSRAPRHLRRQGGRVPRHEAARPPRLRALRRRRDGAPDRGGEREPADPDLSRRRARSRAGSCAKIVELVLDGLGDRSPTRCPTPCAQRHGLLDRPHRDRAHPPPRLRGPDRAGRARTLRMHEAFVLQAALLQQRRSSARCRRPRRAPARCSSASTRRCRSRARPTRCRSATRSRATSRATGR